MGRARAIINSLKLTESNDFNVVQFTDVANSLNALSQIAKAIGDDKLSKKLSIAADEIEKLLKHPYLVPKDDFYAILKKLDINKLLVEVKGSFKAYDDSGKVVKYGRKEVSLPDAIANFQTVFSKAIKDLVKQGFDINKVR